jgi:signal transduction histidine kinase/ActR/RegA family two-component response regulator/HAMP domain-containing protein
MKRGFDLSIGQQMWVGFGAAGLSLALVVVVVFSGLSTMRELRRQQTALIAPRSAAAGDLETAILYKTLSAEGYVATHDERDRLAYERVSQEASEVLLRLGGLADDQEGRALFAPLPELAQDFDREADQIVAQAQAGMTPAEAQQAEVRLAHSRENLLASLRRYADLQEEKVNRARAAIAAEQARTERSLVALSLLVLGLLGATGILAARGVRAPAKRLAAAVRRVAAGDFSDVSSVGSLSPRLEDREARNELDQLTSAFGRMAVALREREAGLAASASFATAMAASLEMGSLCETGLEHLVQYVGVQVGAIYVVSEAPAGRLVRVASFALDGKVDSLALGEGIPGQAALSRRLLVVRDIPTDSPFAIRLGVDRFPPREVVAVPMLLANRVLGVIVLGSVHDLGVEAIAFMTQAADSLAVSLDNAMAHAHARKLAIDLQHGNERLQAQSEELQVQQEELQAQNEELLAQGEELQTQQEELRCRNEELRRNSGELAERGRCLQQVQEELQQANRRKDEFLATLSHELRNPLAPLHSSLYLLQRAEPGSDQANRMMAVMDRQIGQLTTLTNDLLDVTRISRGKITLQCSTVDLCGLVRSAADDNLALFAGHALRLVLKVPDEPLPVYADPARLSQVIGNLVHNAAKFTPADGEVQLTLEQCPGLESARLIVSDTGSGMEPELLAHLFDPFFQGDQSLARTQGGLGLGLALVRALVEMHGGSVKASSGGLGCGSTFTVELPLCRVERESTPPPILLQRPRHRVLVIEDNLDAANSLRSVLELLGHLVETASDGPLGLSRAREFRPQVVFCDIGLPEMDGYAVARALRDEEQLRDTVLVAMTGYAQPEDKRRATEAGFHEHLAKPPTIERLEEVLSRAALSPS